MSIFGRLKDAIFGHAAAAAPSGSGARPPQTTGSSIGGAASGASAASPKSVASGEGKSPAVGGAAQSAGPIDVAAVLDQAVARQGEKLDWRKSIVDLMKAVGLDSSLAARKELARDLDYNGDTNDSATMNVWLHKQVMRKLAENGGKVPDDLRA